MEKRITELEIRYTHQEAFAKQLSTVLFEQQRTIERLEARIAQLERRPSEGADETARPIPNDPPPHY
jgi:SlyX protein